MARPLRLQLAGGVYHVTSRGDGRDAIYLSDDDLDAWLEVFRPLRCTLACIIQRSVGRSKIMKKKRDESVMRDSVFSADPFWAMLPGNERLKNIRPKKTCKLSR